MNKNNMIIVSVILIIVAGLLGFFGGMQYQKMQRPTFAGAQGVQGTAGRFGGGQGFLRRAGQNANFSPVRGQILSIDNGSITVKQQDGTTKIVVVSGSTSFVKSQSASLSDLKTGDTVMILGTSNSDGSVTAQNVSINPQQMRPNVSPTKTQ